MAQIHPRNQFLLIRNGLLIRFSRLVLFLGKIWERTQFSLRLFRPASAKKPTKFFSRCTLIVPEGVGVAFGHTIAAVAKTLLANLLRDAQGIHRCATRVAERM